MTFIKGPGRKDQQKDLGWRQCERAAQIAVCRAFGLTYAQTAVLINSSEKMVTKWVQKYRPFIDSFESFARNLIPSENVSDEPLPTNRAEYKSWFERQMYKLAPQMLQQAARRQDANLTLAVMKEGHRVADIVSQNLNVKHSGKVEHDHEHKVVPAGLLNVVNAPRARRELPPLRVTSITKAENDSDSPN